MDGLTFISNASNRVGHTYFPLNKVKIPTLAKKMVAANSS